MASTTRPETLSSRDRGDVRTRILAAARRLFFAEGFAAVTTDRLCREAGVSKTSLYKFFGDMNGVLAAVVEREGDLFKPHPTDLPTTADAFRSGLVAMGAGLLGLLNQRGCRQFDQTMHEQARRHPDAARVFYESAYGRCTRQIEEYLAHGQSQGFLSRRWPPEALADNLVSMWEGMAYVRARLGLVSRPFREPESWARHCVDVLLAAAGSDAPAVRPLPRPADVPRASRPVRSRR